MNTYGQLIIDHQLPYIFYHSPMLLQLYNVVVTTKVPFRFFNIWIEYEQFGEIIKRHWKGGLQQCTLKSVWFKLRGQKQRIKLLNNTQYRHIAIKVKQIRDRLHQTQHLLSTQYYEPVALEKKVLLLNLEKWIHIDELNLGDFNTKFFSAVMKEKRNKKQIVELSSLGEKLVDPKDIRHEIVSFYQSLTGSALTNTVVVSEKIMRNGLTLDRQQQIDRCTKITDQEIYSGLCSI